MSCLPCLLTGCLPFVPVDKLATLPGLDPLLKVWHTTIRLCGLWVPLCLFPTKSCTHRECLNEEAIFPEAGKEKATPFLKTGRTWTTCILTPTCQFPIGQTHSCKNWSFKRWGGWYVQSNFWLCTFLLHSCVETLLDMTEVCSTYNFLCATHKCVNPTVHSLWKIKVVHREFPLQRAGMFSRPANLC